MYVAVEGGEAAILATHDLVAEARPRRPCRPEISVAQIREQQALACARDERGLGSTTSTSPRWR